MKSFISEDYIEQAICEHLSQPEFGWTRIACDPSPDAQDVNYRRPDVLLFVNGLPVTTPDRTCPHKTVTAVLLLSEHANKIRVPVYGVSSFLIKDSFFIGFYLVIQIFFVYLQHQSFIFDI